MRKLKLFAALMLAFSVSPALSAQETTARNALTAASNKKNTDEALSYLKKTAETITVAAEKREVYTILAGLEEQLGNYADAQKHYAAAAGIQGSAQSSLSSYNKSSEQLVIDAVRCALCAGDHSTAETYLNSSIRQSKDSSILAYMKLYEQWCALSKAQSAEDTKENVAMLKTYASLDSMKVVQPSILLTLWHLTGENSYSEKLKANYPKSMEAAIVKGNAQVLPTPFWYFVPRNGSDLPEISSLPKKEAVPAKTEASVEKKSSSAEKVVKQQLGLFRDKGNAQVLCDKVKSKGFDARIESEVRPSGTTYYLVVVPENKAGTAGKELKNAGFECYPVFD